MLGCCIICWAIWRSRGSIVGRGRKFEGSRRYVYEQGDSVEAQYYRTLCLRSRMRAQGREAAVLREGQKVKVKGLSMLVAVVSLEHECSTSSSGD
jgi:hypothetical protein